MLLHCGRGDVCTRFRALAGAGWQGGRGVWMASAAEGESLGERHCGEVGVSGACQDCVRGCFCRGSFCLLLTWWSVHGSGGLQNCFWVRERGPVSLLWNSLKGEPCLEVGRSGDHRIIVCRRGVSEVSFCDVLNSKVCVRFHRSQVLLIDFPRYD